jgi:hypothetical protein
MIIMPRLSQRATAEESRLMRRRWRELRITAAYASEALAR